MKHISEVSPDAVVHICEAVLNQPAQFKGRITSKPGFKTSIIY